MLNQLFDTTKADDVRKRIKHAVEKLVIPTPEFYIAIGWARDYDQLFASRFSSTSNLFELVCVALSKGHVLLSGRGGGAKTVIVYRLAKHALRQNLLPILVTLKDWTGRDYESWQTTDSQSAKVDFLLYRFGLVPLRTLNLDEISSDIARLLLVDGLNEVNSRTGQEIIYALEEYVRLAPNSRVIVTDRLVRRTFVNPLRWQLALACPLSSEEIKKQIDKRFGTRKFESLSSDTQDLLSSPYFLNAFLKDGQISATRSEEFRTFFLQHALNENELDLAGAAAFHAYRSASRTFSIAEFSRRSSDSIVQKLIDSGALIKEGDLAYFDHHLKHDFLVSRYLARHPPEWNADIFMIVSFRASSFETIMLTLEQIDTTEAADYFLRQVYDWHPYGAGYAIAEARRTSASREMQTVILAMLAERRSDIMQRTAERAADTLNLMRTDEARPFQTAVTLQDIFTIVNRLDGAMPWFRVWRSLYTREPGARAVDEDIVHLTEADSVNGWTSSNVLKRLVLSEEQQNILGQLLRDNGDAVVRWRAAHVLGAFPNRTNSGVLFFSLQDGAISVRLGATRSLIEIAARDANMTAEVFRGLMEHVADIAEHRGVLEEVQRAVFIRSDRVPLNWTATVLPFIGLLQAKSRSPYEEEQWDRVTKELVTTYGM